MESIYEELMSITISSQLVIENKEQKYINITWKDFFDIIKSEHWHKTDKCSCPHDEPLYDHLVNCGKLSYEKAKLLNYNEHDCKKAYLAGLLHDIGKPGTRKTFGKLMSFKGHALVGGALIENFWSDELQSKLLLSKNDWSDISTLADVHMCGYFPDQCSDAHKVCFQMLSDSVKKLLICVRYGDVLSMEPVSRFKQTKEEIRNELMETENDFINNINSELNLVNFLQSNNLDKGVLIQMCGTSSSGKTYLSKYISDSLIDKNVNVKVITRDDYIIKWAYKFMGKKVSDKDPYPKIYQEAIKHYHSTDKIYANRINENIKNDINQYLQQGYIVIVDSLMTMYHKTIASILPESVKNAFKINLWIHRNTMILEDESINRLGASLSEQIELYQASNSILNPFRHLDWDNLISITEKKDITDVSINQAHISLSIGRNQIKYKELNNLLIHLKNIYEFNQSNWRIPLINDTMDYNLQELIHYLYSNGGFIAIKEFFESYNYRVIQPFKDTTYAEKIIGIKYLDGINNIWRPKWAREARGRFYYLSDSIIPLKDALQRGVEILTTNHKSHGINETQDIDISKIDMLDDIQIDILRKFSGDNDINGYLTGKVDGSLIIVNYYPKDSEQYSILKEVISNVGSSFAKIMLDYCLGNDGPLITVSTQGTIVVSDEMTDYVLTALQSLIDFKFTTINDSWKEIYPKFHTMVMEYINTLNFNASMINMCFEAYCKDRISFTNKIHTELAVSYDHSGFNLLGLMKDNNYIPHFDLPNIIFKQPIYLKVNKTKQVFEIMDDMDKVVMGDMTHTEFMKKYFPNNMDYPIHMEGWVFLMPYNDGYDYSKIKTNLYYKCHKVRDNNIKELLSLPSNCEKYYPVLKILRDFYNNHELRITNSIEELYHTLENELKTKSVLYTGLNGKAKDRIDEHIKNPEDEKVRVLAFKILINNCKDEMLNIIKTVNSKYWNNESDELALLMKSILMKSEPWIGNFDRLKEILDNGNYTKELYNIMFNQYELTN